MSIKHSYFKYLDRFGRTVTLEQFHSKSTENNLIALRHDVDHDLDLALEMAYWENKHGFSSSYYLLHSAEYCHDPLFFEKALQIQDFGHEVGLHVNILSEWMNNNISDIATTLREIVDPLRAAGLRVYGISSHGDRLCYQENFINFWCFKELRPENPVNSMAGLTAEGIRADANRKVINYPSDHILRRADGHMFHLWSVSLAELGFNYESLHVPYDYYYSDSGGKWYQGKDPAQCNFKHGRHQVLIHPEHWRAPQKIYFFLSTARSGSMWLSQLLDAASSVCACHEFSLNHRYNNGVLTKDKRTAQGFLNLSQDISFVRQLLIESRNWMESQGKNCAEANVYLEEFLPLLDEVFSDACFVHLHRDPRDVVRSIMNRDWYDTPDDDRHPRILMEDWDLLSQFEKACCYVHVVHERLLRKCKIQLKFEDMTQDIKYLSASLQKIGIAFYPRLAKKLYNNKINANSKADFPEYSKWTEEQKCTFHRILWPIIMTFGYEDTNKNDYDHLLGALLRQSEHYKQQHRFLLSSAIDAVRHDITVAAIDFAICEIAGLTTINCKIKQTSEGVELSSIKIGRHAHCILGGGTWYQIGENDGWTHSIGSYFTGNLSASVEGDGFVQLFALMYNEQGENVGKCKVGLLRSGQSHLAISFRPLNEAHRFTLAIYLAAGTSPKKVLVNRLRMDQKKP